jgi:hypothetical protein
VLIFSKFVDVIDFKKLNYGIGCCHTMDLLPIYPFNQITTIDQSTEITMNNTDQTVQKSTVAKAEDSPQVVDAPKVVDSVSAGPPAVNAGISVERANDETSDHSHVHEDGHVCNHDHEQEGGHEDPRGVEIRKAIKTEDEILNEKLGKAVRLPTDPSLPPSLQHLMDVVLFYLRTRREVTDNSNMVMLIDDRIKQVLESANTLFSLTEIQFYFALDTYVWDEQVQQVTLNTPDVVAERYAILESNRKSNGAELDKRRNANQPPAMADPNKKFCSIC